METIRIFSIFQSIDGEVNKFHQGRISTFIRTAGCNLRCKWCDTKRAQSKTSGTEMDVISVVNKVDALNCKKVTITGGEPLLQEHLVDLIYLLYSGGYRITVESNGSRIIPANIFHKVHSWIMDYKLPSSGMNDYMFINRFTDLRMSDFIKFVIADKTDFNIALMIMERMRSENMAQFALSPLHGKLTPRALLKWLQRSGETDVIINLQLHKYLDLKEDGSDKTKNR